MEFYARDVMVSNFSSISANASVRGAVEKILNAKLRPSSFKTQSLMVTDEFGKLAGVVSIYDILFHFRPSILQYGLDSIAEWQGRLKPFLKEFENKTVEQVMNFPVLTVSPDDHLMVVLDTMIKKKCRRLPVVEDDKLLGIVYQPEVFMKIFGSWEK
ncbi:MAG: CBS domain-containing protein [Desulfococcaceae bacterium]|jgi:CBS domain-containing protein|nr:CBS domain-containing protein [Desulfococcaceae bacterium]